MSIQDSIIEISSIKQYKELYSRSFGKNLLIIDFSACWCGPCKKLGLLFPNLVSRFPNVTIGKIDVDNEELRSISDENDIKSLPTLFFIKNGEKVQENVGFLSIERLSSIVEFLNDHFQKEEQLKNDQSVVEKKENNIQPLVNTEMKNNDTSKTTTKQIANKKSNNVKTNSHNHKTKEKLIEKQPTKKEKSNVKNNSTIC